MTRSPIWHPFTQHGLGHEIPLVTHAEGAVLHIADGRRIIDGISSWWVTTHGHGEPRIMEAIARQSGRLDQIIFAGWTHEPAETLADMLLDIMPEPLRYIFFSDSGSTSVEVALKMALGYWSNIGAPRHKIIVMEHSYHGDTIGAMSVGARGVFNVAYEKLLFDVAQIPFPATGMEQASLDRLAQLCRDEKPAAFIVEPLILGAGGMLVYSAKILSEMREICARHDVLFIADEVMTAWGRTGTLLACEQAGIVPDILCLSKGLTGGSLPLAVTMATEAVYDAHYSTDRRKTFFHSSSYTANPIACAAAVANIKIWQEEDVLARISRLSDWQRKRLSRLDGHPMLANIRQLGTIAAMDVEMPDHGYLSAIGPRMMEYFLSRGILLRPLGNSLYIMPPYAIGSDDLDRIYAAIQDFLGMGRCHRPSD